MKPIPPFILLWFLMYLGVIWDLLSELRITTGPSYRVDYTQKGSEIIILLVGRDKSTQSKDIEKAKELAKEYQNELLVAIGDIARAIGYWLLCLVILC